VKYESIIIETDTGSRNRLKQAALAVPEFGKVEFQSSPAEAIYRLNNGPERCDLVFISYRFDQASIMSFIREAKNAKQGQDAAFIMILESDDNDASKVATNMLVGADGLLFEPFSVDQLVDITRLASKVKKERVETREKAALQFMVNDTITQVDTLASLKKMGYDVGTTLRKFRELCSVLQTLEPTSREAYYQIAIEAFQAAPIPKPLVGRVQYGGVSSRIKKKMENKVIERIAGANSSKQP